MIKLDTIEKDLCILNEREADTVEKLRKLESFQVPGEFMKVVEKKMETLQNKLNTVQKCLGEKDEHIIIHLVKKNSCVNRLYLIEIQIQMHDDWISLIF